MHQTNYNIKQISLQTMRGLDGLGTTNPVGITKQRNLNHPSQIDFSHFYFSPILIIIAHRGHNFKRPFTTCRLVIIIAI